MHCYVHNDREAVGTCVGCGKFICEECNTEVRGKCHCKNCISEIISEKNKKIEKLEDKSENSKQPYVFMNAAGGGGGGSSSSTNNNNNNNNYNNFYPRPIYCDKNKTTAIILALLLGWLGIHRFYLGEKRAGKKYLLFCWTGVTFLLTIVDIIGLLLISEERFMSKYGYY